MVELLRLWEVIVTKPPVKKLTSKIAKQYGGYCLIKADLVFCSYVFYRAAQLERQLPQKKSNTELPFTGAMTAAQAVEPILRAGGTLRLEHDSVEALDNDRRLCKVLQLQLAYTIVRQHFPRPASSK
jgi:hypothetical protein